MTALVLPRVTRVRMRGLTRARKIENLVLLLGFGLVGSLLGLLVGGIVGAPTGGSMLGAALGSGWMLGEVLTLWSKRRKAAAAVAVGPRVNDFFHLDKEITAFSTRSDEDPDLVGPVVAGALEARASLVSACEVLTGTHDLEEPVRSALEAEVDQEFAAVRELLASANRDLDTQKRLSANARNASRVEEVRALLGNGTVTRLRAEVDARAGAFKEIEEMTR